MVVKTATGKEYECSYFALNNEYNCIYMSVKEDPKTVNEVFCDPEETLRIEYNDNVYEGYTRFGNIQVFYDSVRVRLDKHG